MNEGDQHLGLAVNISIEALKALVLVNGGAATALIALTDKSGSGTNYATSVLFFGLGAFLGMVSFVAGYFSQLSYGNHRFSSEHGNTADAQKAFKDHNRAQNVALFLVVASLLSGGVGMASAFMANAPREDDKDRYAIVQADGDAVVRLDRMNGEMAVCRLPESGAVACK